MGCTTPIRFIPSMVAPPASNRTVAKRSSATLEELTLNGDGVANATFITDRELSNSIALAAELNFPRHKYPYKTLDQPSAKKVAYRKSHYSILISQNSYPSTNPPTAALSFIRPLRQIRKPPSHPSTPVAKPHIQRRKSMFEQHSEGT